MSEDGGWEMTFNKNGNCYWNASDSPIVSIYKITYSTKKSDVPAGYENVYTLHLKVTSGNAPFEDATYEMYVNDKYLDLYPWPMGYGGAFLFYRVKPKPTPVEKESEVSPKWELKLSDRDRGYFEGGLAYEQCKKEQDKDVFDRDRQMPIERMEWGSKASRLGLGDCREKAFERIKMRTEEYQSGFKEGWRDASMPRNKEKDNNKEKVK